MKKYSRPAVVILVSVLILIAVSVAEILLVFNVTSEQSRKAGSDRLEVICGELEETINDVKLEMMSFALELQPYLNDRSGSEEFIRRKKSEMLEATGSACFNVYAATEGWYYIPDFDEPEDYQIEKRSWYLGAVRKQGEPFVTDPYVDAMTGDICFSVSVLLPDGKSVAAMDYTMDGIQAHIRQMYADGRQNAVIVTDEGIIAGCSDEKLIGKSLIQNLPDYAGIFTLVKNSEDSVSIAQHSDNLFAARSGFGWYLIVSENNWSLYRTSYIELIAMLAISFLAFGIVLTLYFITARSAKRTQDMLSEYQEFLNEVSKEMEEPVERIKRGASGDSGGEFSKYERREITSQAERLNRTLRRLRSHSALTGSRETDGRTRRKGPANITVSKHFRSIILTALLLVMAISSYINISSSAQYGRAKMQKAAADYEYQLDEWINTQKSILDMFTSTISTNPEMLKDYQATVDFLDRMTKQYPEISVSYMTNPAFEHTVMMSNGWEPDENWHVEEREWYKDLMTSDKNWIISSPYYDEQTGLYCVTFAETVTDYRTGEFLGNFGIDFYMDKLVDILGNSYTDSGYAFLADARGEIINHPYGKYQMTESGSTSILSLTYNKAVLNGTDVEFIKDYDDNYKVLIASRNENSGFCIYVVDSIWRIYRNVFVYGTLCIVVLTVCVIIVYKVMTGLIHLQDEANRKLRESAEAAIAADEAKSSFLAQMSHEIRTPINAVLGMNEMILRESGDTSIREYAGNIQSSGRMLLSLINSILDFSKIEDGKMELIPAEYETAAVISDVVNGIAQRAYEKDLKLVVDADESIPSVLRGDDVRIRQIITNLLTNAVKYTEQGTVTLSVRGEREESGYVTLCVRVEDTGIGIKEEDISALFESFKRLEEKRNRNIEGTGLGMSIVTKLLEMMGSKLEVSSVYGEGSVFSFRLRQEIVDEAPMGNYRRSSHDEDNGKEKKYLYAPEAKVLVVDDNSMNLKVAGGLLTLYGITADTADSGEKALAMLSSKVYDIVFLDHMMPKMDGIEVLAEIRRRELAPPETVMIALTANAIVGAKEMYLQAGFNAYLTKPIESAALEKQLKNSLPESKLSYKTYEQPKPSQAEEADEDSLTYEDVLRIRELCPELNAAAGMGLCMDSKEFWFDTLKGFTEADRSEELCKAFEAEDWEAYRIAVHSVKSAAKTVGADLVSEKARQLEFAARDGDTEFIKAGHEGFITEYRTLIENIGRVLEQ